MNSKMMAAVAVFMMMVFGAVYPVSAPAVEKTQSSAQAVKAENYSEVCMVTNNVVAGMQMIPVEVEGKTYYGCCQGCVGKLKNNRSARYATDPLTGKEVDKARAFIVADEKNKALYFESRETAEGFFASLKR